MLRKRVALRKSGGGLPNRWIRWAGITAISISFAVAPPSLAHAQSIPAGANLNTQAAPNGGTWTLLGDAYLSNGVSVSVLKTLPATFAIQGVPSVSVITLNDGAGHYGKFSLAAGSTLTLSNVALTGGLAASGGAMLFGNGSTIKPPAW